MRSFAQVIWQNFLKPVVDFALPAHCSFCEATLADTEILICASCYSKIQPADSQLIKHLLQEIPESALDEIFIPFVFTLEIKHLIHHFKYKRFENLARLFAFSIAETIKKSHFDLVTGIPLHRVKKRERGYNQSDLIASHLAELSKITFSDQILLRNKYTQSQTKLSRNERIQNVHDVFRLNTDVKNKRILLVDDLITTGSTINACATVLKAGGAVFVAAAAVATPATNIN